MSTTSRTLPLPSSAQRTAALGDVWTARAWPKADIVATTAHVFIGPSSIITGCPLYARKRTSESSVLPDSSGPLILRAQTPGLYLNRPHLKVTSAFSAG